MPKVEIDSPEAKYFQDIEAALAAQGIAVRIEGGYRAGKSTDVERPLIMRASWEDPQTSEQVHTKNLCLNQPHLLSDEQGYERLIKASVYHMKSAIKKTSSKSEASETASSSDSDAS